MNRVVLIVGALALAAGAHPALPAGEPKRHVVEMRGMSFSPAKLTIMLGDTVVWTNRDVVPHTATAPGEGGWDTKELSQGQSFSYGPTGAGEFRYQCSLHPAMQAELHVRNKE